MKQNWKDEILSFKTQGINPRNSVVAWGKCACGCGESTNVSKLTNRNSSRIRGEQVYYIAGHNRRSTDNEAKPYGYGKWQVECPTCHEKRFIKAHRYTNGKTRGEENDCQPCRAEKLSTKIFFACPGCGKARKLSPMDIEQRLSPYCRKCCRTKGKSKNKNGIHVSVTSRGYVMVIGYKDHPLANKARQIPEHWFVFYNESGIDKDSVVWFKKNGFTIHHKNAIRDDNRIQNLELRAPGNHGQGWTIDEMKKVVALYEKQHE